ncbi:hypothetical protein ACMFMG_010853 [Clarireedia jacksonii]
MKKIASTQLSSLVFSVCMYAQPPASPRSTNISTPNASYPHSFIPSFPASIRASNSISRSKTSHPQSVKTEHRPILIDPAANSHSYSHKPLFHTHISHFQKTLRKAKL